MRRFLHLLLWYVIAVLACVCIWWIVVWVLA